MNDKEQARVTRETGGSTFNFAGGNLAGQDLYAVAVFPGLTETTVDIEHLEDRLLNFYIKHIRLLKAAPNWLCVGTWIYNGVVFIDISITVKSYACAVELAEINDQEAIFNLKTMEEVIV